MIVKIQIEADRESGRSLIHAIFTISRIFNYNWQGVCWNSVVLDGTQ